MDNMEFILHHSTRTKLSLFPFISNGANNNPAVCSMLRPVLRHSNVHSAMPTKSYTMESKNEIYDYQIE